MINKRIIFALLYSRGFFYLSRNFRLQKIGDLDWLKKNYSFHKLCEYIDELAFILVTKKPDQHEVSQFFKDVAIIRKKIFAPIIIGGGIRNIKHIKNCFENGADKILINTESQNFKFLNQIAKTYGGQALSLMIDYKFDEVSKKNNIFTNHGTQKLEICINDLLNKLNNQEFGEIILHSIDKDGTSNGYDVDLIKSLHDVHTKPLLLMGGAGKPEHIVEALQNEHVSGVVTSNLFNFLGAGLEICRKKSLENGINLAKFSSVELV